MRHRTHSPAYAALNPAEGKAPDLSEILDISEEGMAIQTSAPLELVPHLNLWLDLSETHTRIPATGQVVWSDSAGRAGIRFAGLSGESRSQLREWLFVNVLTAFDHARALLPDQEEWNNNSNQLISSHNMPKDELASGTGMISGDDVGPADLEAMPRPEERPRERQEARPRERETAVELNGLDRETSLQSIAERALTLTRATGAAIALSEGNDREMTCVASAGSDAPPLGARLQVGTGFSGECVRSGRSLRCDDSEADDRVDRAGCKALGIRSIVAVPIRSRNKVVGVLEVFSPQPYAFNADDIGALQQLTGDIVPAVVHDPAPPPPAAAAPLRKTPSPQTPPPVSEKKPVAEVAAVSTARPAAAVKGRAIPHCTRFCWLPRSGLLCSRCCG